MSLFPSTSSWADIGTGARFSADRRYRYALWRRWAEGPLVNFVMLNPSTADEHANDPTVERCERRARSYGYGGLIVTNLFALRSTDPKALYCRGNNNGDFRNECSIIDAARASQMVICGWGNHGRLGCRGESIELLLRLAGITLYALRITKAGQPQHPLYVGYQVQPTEWRMK